MGCRKDNYQFDDEIVVHPKSFSQSFYIDAIHIKSDSLQVNVFNQYGNSIYNQSYLITNHHFDQFKIDLNAINNGVYFCNVFTKDTSLTEKLIKE